MKNQLFSYWNNTKEMPEILSLLCQGGMIAAPILLMIIVFPISPEMTVNGQRMSYSEVWESGVGVSIVLFLGLATVGCWGMAARKVWSRWALIFTPFIGTLSFSQIPSFDLKWALVNCIFTGAVIYGYLFHSKAVEKYFQKGD